MAARQRLAAGQGELDLGLDAAAAGGPLPVTSSRMAACSAPWSTLTGCWGWTARPVVMRCSGSWCWPGSSSRPASWTACGSWRRQGLRRCRTGPCCGACPLMRRRRSGRSCPPSGTAGAHPPRYGVNVAGPRARSRRCTRSSCTCSLSVELKDRPGRLRDGAGAAEREPGMGAAVRAGRRPRCAAARPQARMRLLSPRRGRQQQGGSAGSAARAAVDDGALLARARGGAAGGGRQDGQDRRRAIGPRKETR